MRLAESVDDTLTSDECQEMGALVIDALTWPPHLRRRMLMTLRSLAAQAAALSVGASAAAAGAGAEALGLAVEQRPDPLVAVEVHPQEKDGGGQLVSGKRRKPPHRLASLSGHFDGLNGILNEPPSHG